MDQVTERADHPSQSAQITKICVRRSAAPEGQEAVPDRRDCARSAHDEGRSCRVSAAARSSDGDTVTAPAGPAHLVAATVFAGASPEMCRLL